MVWLNPLWLAVVEDNNKAMVIMVEDNHKYQRQVLNNLRSLIKTKLITLCMDFNLEIYNDMYVIDLDSNLRVLLFCKNEIFNYWKMGKFYFLNI